MNRKFHFDWLRFLNLVSLSLGFIFSPAFVAADRVQVLEIDPEPWRLSPDERDGILRKLREQGTDSYEDAGSSSGIRGITQVDVLRMKYGDRGHIRRTLEAFYSSNGYQRMHLGSAVSRSAHPLIIVEVADRLAVDPAEPYHDLKHGQLADPYQAAGFILSIAARSGFFPKDVQEWAWEVGSRNWVSAEGLGEIRAFWKENEETLREGRWVEVRPPSIAP